MNTFDIQGARAAGHADADILSYLQSHEPKTFDYAGALEAGYSPLEILNELAGIDDRSSVFDPLQQGAADIVSGVGATARNLGARDTGEALERAGASLAPQKYDRAIEHVLHPQDGESRVGYLPRAVAEAAPGFALDTGAALTGAALGGAVAGPFAPIGALVGGGAGAIGSYFLRNFGGAADARAANRTGTQGAEASTADKFIAGAGTIGEGALGAVGIGRVLNPGRVAAVGARGVGGAATKAAGTAAIEGGVGAGQSVVGQTAQTVGTDATIDPEAVKGSALLGATMGGALSARGLVKDTAQAIRFRESADFPEANARVAARIAERAGRRPWKHSHRPPGGVRCRS